MSPRMRRLASLGVALLGVCPLGVCPLGMWSASPAAADAPPLLSMPSPGLQCRQAIAQAERASTLPPHLLAAIARVESGRRDPQSGAVNPWPWSINVEGQDYVYDTEPQAIAAVRGFQAGGIRSIDIGCMQINLMHHPDAFTSLEQAFDPQANAAYAVKFLTQLREKTGSWDKATAWYHSATPELGDDYLRRVSAALPDEAKITTAVSGPGVNMGLNMGLSMGFNMGMGAVRMGGLGLGGGGMILPTRAAAPRIIPMQGMAGGPGAGGLGAGGLGAGGLGAGGPGVGMSGGLSAGRSLDSYRSFPVPLAMRK